MRRRSCNDATHRMTGFWGVCGAFCSFRDRGCGNPGCRHGRVAWHRLGEAGGECCESSARCRQHSSSRQAAVWRDRHNCLDHGRRVGRERPAVARRVRDGAQPGRFECADERRCRPAHGSRRPVCAGWPETGCLHHQLPGLRRSGSVLRAVVGKRGAGVRCPARPCWPGKADPARGCPTSSDPSGCLHCWPRRTIAAPGDGQQSCEYLGHRQEQER